MSLIHFCYFFIKEKETLRQIPLMQAARVQSPVLAEIQRVVGFHFQTE